MSKDEPLLEDDNEIEELSEVEDDVEQPWVHILLGRTQLFFSQ